MERRLLFPRQSDGCIACPAPLPCPACQPNEECIRINRSSSFLFVFLNVSLLYTFRDCTKCEQTKCVAIGSNTPTSDGDVSKGALVGAIIGTILFLALAIALFLRYRRKILLLRTARGRRDVKDTPAPAEMVLNRPDPTEKPSELVAKQAHVTPPTATIDTPQPFSGIVNPFDDANSIQTAGTEGTNVIPIALVPPDSLLSPAGQEAPSSPVRPVRTPEVNLNLEHLNVSHDNVHTGAGSTRSGVSGMSRNSYMSGASYTSEFLHEAPMIVTPTQGNVRQVLGVVKAEVINTSAPTPDTLKPPPAYRKPVATSPLALASFGPDQILKDDDNIHPSDPFSDENMSIQANYGVSPAPTVGTFGQNSRESTGSTLDMPSVPWNTAAHDLSRPSSLSTQAGSVVDITSATRVNLGLKSPGTAAFRTTMGRLISPHTGVGHLQEQQRHALAHARTPAPGLDPRRISASSAVSAASTRADSILESFPFVPPSPISDRPIRSPPVSPMATQSFTTSTSVSPLNQQAFLVPPTPPMDKTALGPRPHLVNDLDPLPPPPNRWLLGLSNGSNLSSASSGLGSFPFQIESEPTTTDTQLPPYADRRRASLDTLAITSDLSSYPLSFNHPDLQTPK